jgi:hypothetical protein
MELILKENEVPYYPKILCAKSFKCLILLCNMGKLRITESITYNPSTAISILIL